jgi:hypothetical protein
MTELDPLVEARARLAHWVLTGELRGGPGSGDLPGHPYRGGGPKGGRHGNATGGVAAASGRLNGMTGPAFERPDGAVTDTARLASAIDDLGPNEDLDLAEFEEGDSNLFASVEGAPAQSRLPKLKGVPKPGTPAAKLAPAQRAKDGKTIVDLGPALLAHFKATAKVVAATVPADQLRPTDLSLSGYRLRAMKQAIQNGSYKPTPILISDENYILDGHTRWAAQVALGVKNLAVERVNLPVLKALKSEQQFAEEQGLEQPF